MAEYKKTIVPTSELAALRKKVTNWANFNKVVILDYAYLDQNTRLEGRKVYRRKVRFRVVILFLWIFIGFVMGMIFAAAKHPGGSTISLLTVPLVYVAYYFIKRRSRTVEFKILSTGSPDSPALNFTITTSADFDEVKADVNSLATTLM